MHFLELFIGIIAIAIGILWVSHHLKVPSIVGLFVTGILAGPTCMNLISSTHEIEFLAEIGIVLLLFTIGIEFSLSELLALRRTVLVGGFLQMGLTCWATIAICLSVGLGWQASICLGGIVALSSTAIVLSLLQDSGQIESPFGRNTLGILIFQDLAIVPIILLTPLLVGGPSIFRTVSLKPVFTSVAILAVALVGAKIVIPRLLTLIAKTRNRELFLLTILLICFSVGWATHAVGLSLALGAFLAGLIISESAFGHHAITHILPFKDLFTSIFFISIGLLVDVTVFLEKPVIILLAVVGVIGLKMVAAAVAVLLMGYPFRTSVLVGLAVCQIGEFSLILSQTSLKHSLISTEVYQVVLAVTVLSMGLTPFIFMTIPAAANRLMALRLPPLLQYGYQPKSLEPDVEIAEGLSDHLVVVGYGLSGQKLIKAAKEFEIPYVLLEFNPDTVLRLKRQGEPVYFGDATRESVLDLVGIRRASMLVVVINDSQAVYHVCETARRMNRSIRILARTNYLKDKDSVLAHGADDVVSAEQKATFDIVNRMLTYFSVSDSDRSSFS